MHKISNKTGLTIIVCVTAILLVFFYTGNFILTNTIGIYSVDWDLKAYGHITKSGALHMVKQSIASYYSPTNFSCKLETEDNGLLKWIVTYEIDNRESPWIEKEQWIVVDYYTGNYNIGYISRSI